MSYTSPFERAVFRAKEGAQGFYCDGKICIWNENGELVRYNTGRLKQYRFNKDEYSYTKHIYLNEPTEEELKAAGVECEEAFIFLRLLKAYKKVKQRSQEYRERVFLPTLKEVKDCSPFFYRPCYDNIIREIHVEEDLSYSTRSHTIEEFEDRYGGDAGLYIDMAIPAPGSPNWTNNLGLKFEKQSNKSSYYWSLFFTLRKQLFGVVKSAFYRYHEELIKATEESVVPVEQILFYFCGFEFYLALKYVQLNCPREIKIVWTNMEEFVECFTR